MYSVDELRNIGLNIHIPSEFLEATLNHYEILSNEEILSNAIKLADFKDAEQGYNTLASIIKDDPNGEKMFLCFLYAIAIDKGLYAQKGISKKIWDETMAIFGDCIVNSKKFDGYYHFDRGFWVYRQTSLCLFRIGNFDFELYDHPDNKCVALHIPGNIDFSPKAIDETLNQFDEFAKEKFPDFHKLDKTVYSWIIDPKVTSLLPKESNISRFAARFRIVNRKDDVDEVISWVFHESNVKDYNTLKEETSLQKAIKKGLLKGETYGIAFGIMDK